MKVERKKAEEILDTLQKLLDKDPRKLDVDDVHHLRTNTRRTETLVDALTSDSPKNNLRPGGRRAVKLLRRHAGKVRDADVQIVLLRAVSLDGADDQKEYLIEALDEQRTAGTRKLDKFLAAKASKVSKQLEKVRALLLANSRATARKQQKGATSILGEAIERYRELAMANPALSPDNIHEFRKECKLIRYFAELGRETQASGRFIEPMKTIQDAVGSWHDWHAMHALALELGSQHDLTTVILFLGNTEKNKYAEAIRAIQGVNAKLLGSAAAGEMRKKPAAPEQLSAAALLA